MAPLVLVGFILSLASQNILGASIGESKGPLCFYCHSAENPDDCQTVVECSKHEQCYTERYVSEENHEFFRLGCKAEPVCKLLHDFQAAHGTTGTNCLTCCDTKYCNHDLCRNSTLDRVQCYTCSGMLTPHECEQVTTCDYDEVCATEQVITDQFEIRYNAKCKQRQACALIGQPSVVKPVGKRQDELCDQCCTKSFCNRDLCGATEVTYTVPTGSTSTPAPTTAAAVGSTSISTPSTTATPTTRPSTTPAPTTRPSTTPAPTTRPSTTPAPTTRPSTTPVPTTRPSTTPAPTTRPPTTPAPTTSPSTTQAPSTRPTTTPKTATSTSASTSGVPRRGPDCYQCDNVNHPDDCKSVHTCDFRQVCFMGQVLSHREYNLRCMDAQTCIKAQDETDRHQRPILDFVKYSRVGCCSGSSCHGFTVPPSTATTSPTVGATTTPKHNTATTKPHASTSVPTTTVINTGNVTCYKCGPFDERTASCSIQVQCQDGEQCFVGLNEHGQTESLCLSSTECTTMANDVAHQRQYYHLGVRYRQGRCCQEDLCNMKLLSK